VDCLRLTFALAGESFRPIPKLSRPQFRCAAVFSCARLPAVFTRRLEVFSRLPTRSDPNKRHIFSRLCPFPIRASRNVHRKPFYNRWLHRFVHFALSPQNFCVLHLPRFLLLLSSMPSPGREECGVQFGLVSGRTGTRPARSRAPTPLRERTAWAPCMRSKSQVIVHGLAEPP